MENDISAMSVAGEEEQLLTTSVTTLRSSDFLRRIIQKNDEEEGTESGGEEDEGGGSVEQQSSQLPEESFHGVMSSDATLLMKDFSVETLAGPDGVPYRSNTSFLEDTKPVKLEDIVSQRKIAVQRLPLPTFEITLERLKGEEKFDPFSEDEEPVLKKDYQPVVRDVKERRGPEVLDVREERIFVYNVRKDGVPQLKKLPRWSILDSEERLSSSSRSRLPSSRTFSSKPTLNRNSVHHNQSLTSRIPSKYSMSTPHQSIRRPRRVDKKCSGLTLNENFKDTTPHERDLFFVSYEELSPKEVAVIKGLWKCITFDLWTFGALVTINLFKLRGHITAKDPKATPDVMMDCRFLWPHANHVMKALESVVMNLGRPSVSHRLIYDVGRKHWKLKIPITDYQKQLSINAFMYTFADHVHPRPNLTEMRTMRKFCTITMFLFADASRWDSEPSIPF